MKKIIIIIEHAKDVHGEEKIHGYNVSDYLIVN